MIADFDNFSSHKPSVFTQTFSGPGPFKMGEAFFENKESWARHAQALIRALNLHCISIDEIKDGYQFTFMHSGESLAFDYIMTGENRGEFSHTRNFDNVEFMAYADRAARAHFVDKGINTQVEQIASNRLKYTFERKSDYVSFSLAVDEIDHIAAKNKKAAEAPKPPEV